MQRSESESSTLASSEVRMTSTWGGELWDKFCELSHLASSNLDFVDSHVVALMKERAKVESEYAKGLRSIAKKFSVANDEELSHIKGHLKMLEELGYQAGQHELLSETLSKEVSKALHERVKALKEERKRIVKSHEKAQSVLKSEYKAMESAKEKFRKAFDEMEKARLVYERANNDGAVTKNEMAKLKMHFNNRTQLCEDQKTRYASQLVRTNSSQNRFYTSELPSQLNALQSLEKSRIALLSESVSRASQEEQRALSILNKCLQSVEHFVVEQVDAEKDAEAVIERLKSGDVPPGEFRFEDVSDPHTMLSVDCVDRPIKHNLYPRKKELRRRINLLEDNVAKKKSELNAVLKMAKSYADNPKFGNSKRFQERVKPLQSEIASMDHELEALRTELVDVEHRLDTLRSQSPMIEHQRRASEQSSLRSTKRSSVSLNPRFGSSSSSSVKSQGDSSNASIPMTCVHDDEDDDEVHWHEDVGDVLLLEPPLMPGSSSGLRCVALYDFQPDAAAAEEEENCVALAAGDHLVIVEEDCDGWTRVRKDIDNNEETNNNNEINEGYVPTAFLRML